MADTTCVSYTATYWLNMEILHTLLHDIIILDYSKRCVVHCYMDSPKRKQQDSYLWKRYTTRECYISISLYNLFRFGLQCKAHRRAAIKLKCTVVRFGFRFHYVYMTDVFEEKNRCVVWVNVGKTKTQTDDCEFNFTYLKQEKKKLFKSDISNGDVSSMNLIQFTGIPVIHLAKLNRRPSVDLLRYHFERKSLSRCLKLSFK